MKAGKEGPMKKNFAGAFKNTTVYAGGMGYEATEDGIYVKGPGGKKAKYAVGDKGYDGAKQAYIDAGGTSPYNLGSSTGLSGQQGRAKMVKPMTVDIDGQYDPDSGRRKYAPASVGTVSAMNMKSPKKLKPTKGAQGRVKNVKPQAKPNKRNYNF